MKDVQAVESIYVTKPSMPPKEEYFAEVAGLWETGILTHSGEKHQLFEAMLKEFTGAECISLFSNGHQGLEAIFNTLEPGGEVITTPFTFASTTNAIVRAGLKPVFCDIRPSDYTIEPEIVETLVNERTVAIAPVHVYGNVCDVDALQSLANAHGLKVFYDAAHAFGERYHGKSVALYGDASMFSFHATKVMNTGEGGAVACGDANFKRKIDAWKYYGFESSGSDIAAPGTNAKMTEFAAAMGICNMRHFEEELAKRRHVFERYRDNLLGCSAVRFCAEQEGVESNHAYLPVCIESRDSVIEHMEGDGIFPRKYFYPLTSEYSCFAGWGFDPAETPVSLDVSRKVMTLPMYASLTDGQVDRVCRSLIDALNR